MNGAEPRAPLVRRLWTYQGERFPVLVNGPLIAAFSVSAVSYSGLLRGPHAYPSLAAALVAFVTCFVFFLQLRIADEFKDAEEDAQHRPYRPVPRGLVTLRELAALGWAGGALQLGLALWLGPWLLIPLAAAWLYFALMSREFFVRDWLRNRPITYMWTHMLVMPIIDFYAAACDWLAVGQPLPAGLLIFVAVSFANGFVIEIGRKIRPPHEEEPGVQTYSARWGHRPALGAWIVAQGITLAIAVRAAAAVGFLWPVVGVLVAVLLLSLRAAAGFARAPIAGCAQRIEKLSGLWTLALYLMLGAAPLALRAAGWLA